VTVAANIYQAHQGGSELLQMTSTIVSGVLLVVYTWSRTRVEECRIQNGNPSSG
jgi:hypothetical protein